MVHKQLHFKLVWHTAQVSCIIATDTLCKLIHLGIHTELSLEAIQDLQLQSFTVSLCKVKLTVCMCEHALNLDFNPD